MNKIKQSITQASQDVFAISRYALRIFSTTADKIINPLLFFVFLGYIPLNHMMNNMINLRPQTLTGEIYRLFAAANWLLLVFFVVYVFVTLKTMNTKQTSFKKNMKLSSKKLLPCLVIETAKIGLSLSFLWAASHFLNQVWFGLPQYADAVFAYTFGCLCLYAAIICMIGFSLALPAVIIDGKSIWQGMQAGLSWTVQRLTLAITMLLIPYLAGKGLMPLSDHVWAYFGFSYDLKSIYQGMVHYLFWGYLCSCLTYALYQYFNQKPIARRYNTA